MSSIVIHRLSPFSHLHSLRKKNFLFLFTFAFNCSSFTFDRGNRAQLSITLQFTAELHFFTSLNSLFLSKLFPHLPCFFFSPKLLPVYSLLPCFLVLSSPPVSPVSLFLSTSPSPPSPSLPPGGRLPSENLQGGTNKCCYVIQCYVMPSNALSS